jgi:hypothetical protein
MAMKARRIFVRILVVLVAVVTLTLLVRAVFNYTTGKALEKYLANAKAEDIPLSVKNMLPDCLDADNGEQLWKAAEALIIIEKQDGPLMARMANEWDLEKPLDEKVRKDLSLFVEKNRKALDLAAEASARPCFRSGDWNGSLYTPNTQRIVHHIQMAKLLAAEATLRGDRGDIEGALAECRIGLRLAWRIMDEPSLINALVSNANAKLMLFAFQWVARRTAVESETLEAWMKEMDAGSWRVRLNRCIPFERALGLDWGLRALGERPERFADSLTTVNGGKGIDNFFLWWARPIMKSQFMWIHKRYGELERIADEPYYKQREFLDERHLERVPWYYKPTGVLFPEFHSVFLKEASLEAMMLATRAGLASKIYKSRTGHYPEGLEALVPDILPEIPIDPFTGKPLVFRIKDGELLIYSLGSNGKDDGGRSSLITRLVMEKDDDWTWREKTNR